MDPELLNPLLAVATALSLGGMALVGIRMWVNRIAKPDPDKLADAISRKLREDVREEITRAMESRDAELEELQERVDFAERLLTQGRPEVGD
jgi:hypothetical protein